jgi:hypothetical protein
MIIQDILKLLSGNGVFDRLNPQQSSTGNAGGQFGFLSRGAAPQPAGLDPNLDAILTSRNVTRNRRDTAGNNIPMGSQSYWSGPSGLDAYKAMQPKNTGPNLPGFGGGGTQTAIANIINKVSAYKSKNPNEVMTGNSLRRVLGQR